ncbi:unnamed protein product [Onchocerca flexuosa]|uniref:Fibronectin type-III domain-containing protein n=1 Tax=Onchocerca flexuosa TaxID=387005 RepID=A0A183HKH7_9BILA|nr:unnamed protein product [Onchocerca flexuosa]
MKREGEEKWVTAIETTQSNVTVKELEPGSTYRFRVRTVVANVTSEPSEESELVRAFKSFVKLLMKFIKLEKELDILKWKKTLLAYKHRFYTKLVKKIV